MRHALIILKAKKRNLASYLIGTTIKQVVNKSSSPILILPPDYSEINRETNIKPQLKRILVNFDFTPNSGKVLRYALKFAKSFDAEIHVLHIVPDEKMTTELGINSIGLKILENSLLIKIEENLFSEECDTRRIVKLVRIGNTHHEILKYATNKEFGLICTALPKPRYFLDTFLPSWVEKLLHYSNCPLMVQN